MLHCHSIAKQHRDYCYIYQKVLKVFHADTAKMSYTTASNRMLEKEYLIGDLLPIGLSFFVGFITLLILVVLAGCLGKCKNIGNFLILWLYGGSIAKVNNGNLSIDDKEISETNKNELKWLRALLLVNAVTLLTLLAMIFCDAFFVTSDFDLGCLANIDCYIADNNYTKQPLNCSHFFNRDEKIACYQFKLDFFQAFADTEVF